MNHCYHDKGLTAAWLRLIVYAMLIGTAFIAARAAALRPLLFSPHAVALERGIYPAALFYTDIVASSPAEQVLTEYLTTTYKSSMPDYAHHGTLQSG